MKKNVYVCKKIRMLNKPILIFIFSVFVNTIYAQDADNTNKYNDKNIYLQTLTKYLDYVNADTIYIKMHAKIDTLFVEGDGVLTDSLIDHIGSTKIIIVKNPHQYIKLRKGIGFTLFRLFPLEYKDNEFSVSFIPFIVTTKNKSKQLYYANPGGYKAVFKFENKKFYFIRIVDYGI